MKKIDIFNNIEELRTKYENLYEVIKDIQVENISLGSKFLSDGIYYNVAEYITKEMDNCKFESHRKYVDVQYILEGAEIINIASDEYLKDVVDYDLKNDISFYNTITQYEKIRLSKGQMCILFPSDIHMPCVRANVEALNVKKMVVKIPLSYFKRVKYLIMDVDGTLTDGKIYMSDNGELMKSFDIKDGYGIANILKEKSIIPYVITGRKSDIVTIRCREIGINNVFQGVDDKLNLVKNLFPIEELDKVAYIGDDINDLSSMMYIKKKGGIIGCPRNSAEQIIRIADFVSDKNGGNGAVRDLIEWL